MEETPRYRKPRKKRPWSGKPKNKGRRDGNSKKKRRFPKEPDTSNYVFVERFKCIEVAYWQLKKDKNGDIVGKNEIKPRRKFEVPLNGDSNEWGMAFQRADSKQILADTLTFEDVRTPRREAEITEDAFTGTSKSYIME